MVNANFNKYYKIAYSFKEDSNAHDIEILHRDLHLSKNDSILDVWCGYGRISNILLKDDFDVAGIDYYEDFIKEAIRISWSAGSYVLWNFTQLRNSFKEGAFDKAYSMYSCLWHGSRKDDQNTFESIAGTLKKWWLFLLEYENLVYHSQAQNSQKNEFYEIDWKYRRVLKIKMEALESRLSIGNELWDLQSQEKLHSWDFLLNLYTQWEIRNMALMYDLELISVHGRYSDGEVYWYEPQAFFVFRKR